VLDEPALPRIDATDPVVDWILRALAIARATDAPNLACLAGIQAARTTTGAFELGLGPAEAPQRVGITEVAMLGDLVLGGALRTRVGRERPLPTLSLAIELTAMPRTASTLVASATEVAVREGTGTAAAVLRDCDTAIGHASATFAIPSRGSHRALPWEQPDGTPRPPALAPEQLSAAERTILRIALDAEDAGRDSWGDHLVRQFSASSTGPGPAALNYTPTPVVTNRAGAVQGAVLFALAAHGAAAAAGGADVQMVSGSMRYVSATDAGADVLAEASIEQAARRTIFVRSQLTQVAGLRASAGFVFRSRSA
jgi:acyl-coenzyme A thioesterase PaaI-like protein